MQAVTITQITPPELKDLIKSSLREILLSIENKAPAQPELESLLTVQEAAKFLHLSVPTVYTKISKGELPVIKNKGSKRCYFSKSDLFDYLKTGRKKTNRENEFEAEKYLNKKTVTSF